ncbi:Clp protease/crotonase-like domain-containing protein [Anaeromyxobacter terrae]|uniref:hypothetical protein n=1 Tax=Anaeromyxobacter terrae TaxID=2925406 RepID=UPI001F5ACE16|nr:hypothetical protein [Anaeromyxobacter sp. SG22]
MVVYIAGRADSTGTVIACAGDYVLAHPDAWIGIHSGVAECAEERNEVNRRFLSVYVARTGMTREELEEALAPPPEVVTGIPASAAAALGWADFMGDEAEARRFVDSIAKGWRPAGPRRDMLTARAANGWPAATLEATGLTNAPGAAYQGTWCRVVQATDTNWTTLALTPRIPIAEGETVYAEAMIAPEATAVNNGSTLKCGVLVVSWLDSTGVEIGSASAAPSTAGTYGKVAFSATAPAGVSTMRLRADVQGQAKKAYLDNLVLRKEPRGGQVRGYIAIDGSILKDYGFGFTCSKIGTGTYEITHPSINAANTIATVSGEGYVAGTFGMWHVFSSPTRLRFTFWDHTGTMTDARFAFSFWSA